VSSIGKYSRQFPKAIREVDELVASAEVADKASRSRISMIVEADELDSKRTSRRRRT
jgi:hypothetical protein